jgi:hypothetical protein
MICRVGGFDMGAHLPRGLVTRIIKKKKVSQIETIEV